MCPARVQARVCGVKCGRVENCPGLISVVGARCLGFYYRAKTPASCASEPASLALSTIHTFGFR
jgi:hypothetical protein